MLVVTSSFEVLTAVTRTLPCCWLACQTPGAGIMVADDRQVTTVFTVQPSFHHRHSTNQISWRVTIVGERAVTPHLVLRWPWECFMTLGLLSADGGRTVGLRKLSSLDGRRPQWYRPLALLGNFYNCLDWCQSPVTVWESKFDLEKKNRTKKKKKKKKRRKKRQKQNNNHICCFVLAFCFLLLLGKGPRGWITCCSFQNKDHHCHETVIQDRQWCSTVMQWNNLDLTCGQDYSYFGVRLCTLMYCSMQKHRAAAGHRCYHTVASCFSCTWLWLFLYAQIWFETGVQIKFCVHCTCAHLQYPQLFS